VARNIEDETRTRVELPFQAGDHRLVTEASVSAPSRMRSGDKRFTKVTCRRYTRRPRWRTLRCGESPFLLRFAR
jgi:hypothetical protein